MERVEFQDEQDQLIRAVMDAFAEIRTIPERTKVYLAFPLGTPGYSYIEPLMKRIGAERLDDSATPISGRAVIFYLLPVDSRIERDVVNVIEKYRKRCSNVVAILSASGGHYESDYRWIPSMVNGERVEVEIYWRIRAVDYSNYIPNIEEVYEKMDQIIASVR